MIPSIVSPLHEGKVITIRNLKYVYEGGVTALVEVSLDFKRGEYAAIVGGNGSGKTTLAKTLNGLLRPTSGQVLIEERDASQMTVAELAKTVGYAFQNPDHQLFCSSVEEEIRFGPQNLGYPEDEVRKNVDRAVEAMALGKLRAVAPLSLRLGERRRVSIASVIAMNPEVLILDEPSTGLDNEETEELMAKLKVLNDEGKTIILITHDMRLVADHAKRVIVLSQGRVLLDSDPRGAFSDLDLLRQSNLQPPAVTQLAHRLVERGIPKDIISPQELVFQVLRAGGIK